MDPLVIESRALITIGIIVTFMFYTFFNSLARSRYLLFNFLSILLWDQPRQQSPQFSKLSFFCCWLLFGVTVSLILGDQFVWKSQKSLCASFSRRDDGLCIYHLFVWSVWNFLHNFQMITLPTQSCLVWYAFCDNLLHSLISIRLYHHIAYIWCFVSSCFDMISSLLLLLLLLLLLFVAVVVESCSKIFKLMHEFL